MFSETFVWCFEFETENQKPYCQTLKKNKKTKTKLQPLTETWVAVLAGDMNCLLRCPCTVWSMDSSGWGTTSPPRLTPFLEKCRGHGGRSEKQSELVLRNIFYSWEWYIRGNLAWLSFVTGLKWEALESWHFVKMPLMCCAALPCTLWETGLLTSL